MGILSARRDPKPFSFDSFFSELLDQQPSIAQNVSTFARDQTFNYKDFYLIDIDVPGLTRDQIKIDRDGDVLKVSGTRKSNSAGTALQENSQQSFVMSYQLPKNTPEDAISAKLENGVLSLNIRKPSQSPSSPKRSIPIE